MEIKWNAIDYYLFEQNTFVIVQVGQAWEFIKIMY